MSDDLESEEPATSVEAVATPVMPSKALRPHIASGIPIVGFTGVNGAGKTLLATSCAIGDMSRGRDVYSTVPISSKYGDSKPIRSLSELLHIRHATLLLDEVAVIFSSRSTMALPGEIVLLLQTLRHSDITVYWTAPNWMRADPLLRQVTQGVVNVSPLIRQSNPESPWPRPLVIMAGLMDTTTGKADSEPERVLRRKLYVPTKMLGFGAYDTHADMPLLGAGRHSSTCSGCFGRMETPKHSRERHEQLGIPWYDD